MPQPWGGTPLDRVHLAAHHRSEADAEYRDALAAARGNGHTWKEIANAAGVTIPAVRHIVRPRNRRKEA